MSDTYLIDGYNLIFALGLLHRQSSGDKVLEEARHRLLTFLHDSFGADSSLVTIVFDASHAPRWAPRELTYRGLHIQFAAEKPSADDVIETLIETHPQPQKLVVISNDMRLLQAAHRRGARAWNHTELLDFFDQRAEPDQPKASTRLEEKQTKPMSPEEWQHWMREFGAMNTDPEFKEFFDMDRFGDAEE
jgi:uncharacterized protein